MGDENTEMAKEAYDETIEESLGRGLSTEKAHAEGLTAAAMLLSAMTGIEDAAARAQVEAMGFSPTG